MACFRHASPSCKLPLGTSPWDLPRRLSRGLELSRPESRYTTRRAVRRRRLRRDRLAGMGNGHDGEAVDVFEIRGFARVNGQAVRHCGGGVHCVMASGGDFAVAAVKRGGDLAKDSRRLSVEWQWVEVALGLLKMYLSSRAVLIVGRYELSYRQLVERHSRDTGSLGSAYGSAMLRRRITVLVS